MIRCPWTGCGRFLKQKANRWMKRGLQELKTRATNLLTTARKLPPGFERQRLLVEIGKYRREISALKNSLWDQQKENDHR